MPADGSRPLLKGRVLLVGAGPGDPDHLTVKAARVLAQADVVFTDGLVGRRVLALAGKARIVDVGKTPGGVSTPQDRINELLLTEARKGGLVVRLKGGDPFVFGRGGEEALFLGAHGVDVEVVPGLSSALTVPAVAGIPLTHRGVAQSFTVLTGTAASSSTDWLRESGATAARGPPDLEAQWEAAAKTGGTLVFLMAMHCLDRVVAAVTRAGVAVDTPCAVIVRGTHADETIVETPLCALVEAAQRHRLRSPAVVVIGEVVGLRAGIVASFARDQKGTVDVPV